MTHDNMTTWHTTTWQHDNKKTWHTTTWPHDSMTTRHMTAWHMTQRHITHDNMTHDNMTHDNMTHDNVNSTKTSWNVQWNSKSLIYDTKKKMNNNNILAQHELPQNISHADHILFSNTI